MADKIPVKTVIVIPLLCGIIAFLYACMNPVNYAGFLGDDKVQKFIEDSNKAAEEAKKAVKVDDKTGDGLIGRAGRIEGLKNNRYYMVEKEIDADGAPVPKYNNQYSYPVYVTDHLVAQIPGGLWGELQYITRVSGGSINGLTDFHTYTVRAAVAFSNTNLDYNDSGGKVEKQVSGGVINIDGIYGEGSLDLSKVLSGSYEVIAVSDNNNPSPWNWTSKTNDSWASFKLEGSDTAVDYVFVKKDASLDFKVLRVVIGQSYVPGVNFTITFTFSDKASASITGGGPVNLTNLWAATLPTTYTLTLGTAPNSGTWTGV
ncbi:MAG: hypothetical protein LBB81_11210, partial [Treponema sp.]|nr:hypothetical protein [Treponema sp.]